MFKFLKAIFAPSDKRSEAESHRENTLELLMPVFHANGVKVTEINSVYVFDAGDYSDDFFRRVRLDLEAGNPIKHGNERFTWNKPHLHFHLAVVDGERLFVIAIVFPYEFTQARQVLMFQELHRSIDDPYVQQLMFHKIV